MKIAILQDDFPPRHVGGAGAIAFASAKELQQRGHEVIVITTERSRESAGKSIYEGLTIYAIATDYNFRYQAYVSLWNPRVVREVTAILKSFKPDVVHAHRVHGYLSYESLVVADKLGARVILTCHDVMPFNYGKFVEYIDPHDFSIPKKFNYKISPLRQLKDSRWRYNPFRNLWIRHVLNNHVDHVVAVSDALRQALEVNGIRNVLVIRNGIDVTAQRVTPEALQVFKKKYHITDSAVFFTGKPVGVKGAGRLVEALSKIRSDIKDLQLVVVGRGDEQLERILSHAHSLGVENTVVTGWLFGEELKAAYEACALVVVPTLSFDAFPTVNLEAMAAGKPVIATCFGGSREAVVDGETGYIVNPFDVDVLALRVKELLLDRSGAARFGSAGEERVRSEFKLEQQAKSYEDLYVA